jgi:hypothetical protein
VQHHHGPRGCTPRGPTKASESGHLKRSFSSPPVASARTTHLGPPRFTRGAADESERKRAPEAKLQQPASRERSKVRATGLEPARVLPHGNLNPVRLPIPPRPRSERLYEKCSLSRFPSFFRRPSPRRCRVVRRLRRSPVAKIRGNLSMSGNSVRSVSRVFRAPFESHEEVQPTGRSQLRAASRADHSVPCVCAHGLASRDGYGRFLRRWRCATSGTRRGCDRYASEHER